MNNFKTHTKTAEQFSFSSRIADLGMLFKARLTMLVIFSSVMAYFIGASSVNSLAIVLLIVGGALVTFAANTLNQVLEKDYDILMKRTANRPLPQGRISVSSAVLLAGFLSLIGIGVLCLINVWAGLLGTCLLYTSPSPRDRTRSRMPSSA